ncbi:MAG: hypothetical protein ACODAE_07375 [Gemmatimonadota bacterium]
MDRFLHPLASGERDREGPTGVDVSVTCQLCGSRLGEDARVVSVRVNGPGALAIEERRSSAVDEDGSLLHLCTDHPAAIRLLRGLGRESAAELEARIRGRLYQELDLLAFALEMEASTAVERGDDGDVERAQRTRLGVRLAQRLVGGVPAPEVDERLARWRESYEARFPF